MAENKARKRVRKEPQSGEGGDRSAPSGTAGPGDEIAAESGRKAANECQKSAVRTATVSKLLDVALDAWEDRGYAGISARGIAHNAGQPVSSIYYHFGDLERLLIASQDHALELAQVWCATRIAAMPPISPAEAMAPFMAALVQDWSVGHRRLAFAWHECQLLAGRNPDYLPALHRWNALWTAFWESVCTRCGVPDLARLSQCMFDGESFLHLIRGNLMLDAACLIELCQGWGDWLSGRPAEERAWRRRARLAATQAAEAARLAGNSPEGAVAERIAAAAADLVTREGPASLTHRAVAAEAGLTLGAISYHFRSSTDLMRIAFETVYRRVMKPNIEPDPAARQEQGDYGQAAQDGEAARDLAMSRIAMNELILAVARDESLQGYAAQLRYLRGQTSRNVLAKLFGGEDAGSPLEAALMSNISFGRSRAYIGLTEAERNEARARDLAQVDALLLATRKKAQDK